jgi:hypothetical protein
MPALDHNLEVCVMKMKRSFLANDEGLVTIEWVAIAAVAFLAAVGISTILMQGADGLGGAVAGRMAGAAEDIGDP